MKIALIGYGKMGKAIEEIAHERGHDVVLRIDHYNLTDLTAENIRTADVAIEFTNPHAAFENIKFCMDNSVPVVSGTTGWLNQMEAIKAHCKEVNGTFLYASNFSIGVNLFFELNRQLAKLMYPHQEYSVSVKEVHHTQKLDAPSGTAITLAQELIENYPSKKSWVNHSTENPAELAILSERVDPAPGTHFVKYSSEIDDIEIIHTAHSRKGFATGAVLAAEFLLNKKGVYGMRDVLGI
ncbi:MAG: 4-hydroxy-tetrahydrodipicolinate reductase [Sphingobacteriales bacterium]|nr:4-hydroxy-tetrahydrodipicolinate reductase [Sphingobacteriales bacterium]MBI3720770.1 4-hydroxy-tetrahydrodipicolinate reductase [Sphingobacteriales bacterium]